MNKKKIIVKVEKVGGNKKITDKTGMLSMIQTVQKGERIPKVSYWEAFIVLSKVPRIKFYRQLYDQEF